MVSHDGAVGHEPWNEKREDDEELGERGEREPKVFVRLGAFLAILPAVGGDGEEEGAEEEEGCEESHDGPLEGTADHSCSC